MGSFVQLQLQVLGKRTLWELDSEGVRGGPLQNCCPSAEFVPHVALSPFPEHSEWLSGVLLSQGISQSNGSPFFRGPNYTFANSLPKPLFLSDASIRGCAGLGEYIL
jgi:hypothetical protein